MLILVRENNYNFICSVGGDTTCGGEGREGGDVRQFVDLSSFLVGGQLSLKLSEEGEGRQCSVTELHTIS